MQLDADNPWPGLDPFQESSRSYFYGRDRETEVLFDHVFDAPVTVLYGRSGLGKTSLLQAGLFPLLRQCHFLPIYVRFDIRTGAAPITRQLRDSVGEALVADAAEADPPSDEESLWQYLHRADLELWSARNYLLTPVIVLDQFEEVFTLGERLPNIVQELRDELGDLAENRIPDDLANRIEQDAALATRLDLRSRRYKLLICLREDFLPELEGWRQLIPALGRSRMRLLRMQANEALEAVLKPAGDLLSDALARRVVGIVAGEDDRDGREDSCQDSSLTDKNSEFEVEPALLSLFCRELNEERKRRAQPRFNVQLVESAKRDILSNYYRSCVRDLPPRVARFIETELITEKGFRNSYAREDAVPLYLTMEELSQLIRSRLLRLEERYGAQRIELTHDILTTVVREQRDKHRAEEERAALAAKLEAERLMLEQAAGQREAELERQRLVERERRLEAEARAGKVFRWLSAVLALVSVVAIVLAVAASRNLQAAIAANRQVAAAEGQNTELRSLAERRLERILDGIRIEQAVLSGDRVRIDGFLQRDRSDIAFVASAESLGYRNLDGQEIFRFTLSPDANSLRLYQYEIAAITYRIDHPTFRNALFTAGPESEFAASYTGWGCLQTVTVLIKFFDPDRIPEVTEFDMCASLGW